jgi:hypothetical protein
MNQKKTSEIPIQAAFVSLVHFKKIKPLYQSTPPLMTFFLSSKERTNPFYSALMFGNIIFTPQNIPCVFDYSSLLLFSAKHVQIRVCLYTWSIVSDGEYLLVYILASASVLIFTDVFLFSRVKYFYFAYSVEFFGSGRQEKGVFC